MPVRLPTRRVLALCHPLKNSPWETSERVTRKLVQTALRTGVLKGEPVQAQASAVEHAARIAYLIANSWDDAIEIDVGVPSMGCHIAWPVTDGNHRLAAAAYRGDKTILADVGGCLDYAMDLFGVDCAEIQDSE